MAAKKPAAKPKAVERKQSVKPAAPANPLMLDRRSWDRSAVMAIVCGKIATSETGLRTILEAGHDGYSLPNADTIMVWLSEDTAFSEQYARAREAQADMMAEKIIQIADEEVTVVRANKHPGAKEDDEGNVEVAFDSAAVARNRLRVDARKWLASRLAPKKYGDRVQNEHSGPDGGNIPVSLAVSFVPSGKFQK